MLDVGLVEDGVEVGAKLPVAQVAAGWRNAEYHHRAGRGCGEAPNLPSRCQRVEDSPAGFRRNPLVRVAGTPSGAANGLPLRPGVTTRFVRESEERSGA